MANTTNRFRASGSDPPAAFIEAGSYATEQHRGGGPTLAAVIRTALPSLVAVLTLGLGACGVSSGDELAAGDEAATETTGGGATTTTEDGGGSTTTEGGSTTTAEDESESTTTTTERSTTTTPGSPGNVDDMVRDALIDGFVQAGMTPEQSTCLADTFIDMGLTDPDNTADMDIMAMMDAFSECGISMEDLVSLGGGFGA